MNKTEPFTPDNQHANCSELINSIKFLLPSMDDFIPKSAETNNYLYDKLPEISEIFLEDTQQRDFVLRQVFLWKQ